MRYFFESKVEKKEKGYMIQIPFNVWEVCKQRDVIKAAVVLDNNVIDCELLPLEKGNYEIHINDEDAVSVELGVPHKVLLHDSILDDRSVLGSNALRVIHSRAGLAWASCKVHDRESFREDLLAHAVLKEGHLLLDCRCIQGIDKR